MSDWAKNVAGQFKKANDEKAAREAFSVHQAEEIKRRAPDQWKELRNLIEKKCSELNTEFGVAVVSFEAAPSERLRVRRLGLTAGIEGTYKPDVYVVELRGTGGMAGWSEELRAHYSESTRAVYLEARPRIPKSFEEIANDALERLMKIDY
jgi:hypothetical protein